MDVGDAVAPLEPPDRLGCGVAARQAVGPVRADEHEAVAHTGRARRGRLGEALERGDALGVGPVQVLEHDERGVAAGPVAQRPHEVDTRPHALLGRAVGVAHGRREGREIGVGGVARRGPECSGVHCVEEQLHRPPDRARVGLAREHEGAAGGAPHELLHEPGLADARLARHQGDRRDRARADECGQAVELDRPAHHHGRQTGPAHEHTVMVRPAGRGMAGWGWPGPDAPPQERRREPSAAARRGERRSDRRASGRYVR